METKHALIIGVCIIIGFTISPLLKSSDKIDYVEPTDRLIKVVDTDETDHMGYAYQFFVRVGDIEWIFSGGRYRSKSGSWYPADAYALKALLEYHGRY